jgi:hypothetical protein
MNLRDIKKDIEYVIGAFIEDCSLFSSTNINADQDALEEIINKAVNLYNDLKDKVNAKVEKKNAAYFAAIRKELLEKTNDLYDELSQLVKSSNTAKKEAPAKEEASEAEKPAE